MVLLILITAVASALLDNVTTVLLIAPVTILLCQRLALPVVPYLLAEVFASNVGGTATLVGDPPNIVIASRGGLSFNDFLLHLAPVVVVLLALLIGLRWLFADAFHTDKKRIAQILAERAEAIEDPRLLVQSLTVLGVVLAAFVLSPVLGYAPSVVALLGAGLLIAITRISTETALQDVEWPTLTFFMGLFVMVGGLVELGVLDALAHSIAGFADTDPLAFTGLLLWGSRVLSGIVDNIPYVASMSPVIADIVGPDGEPQVLWWALALGADLGGNATSSAPAQTSWSPASPPATALRSGSGSSPATDSSSPGPPCSHPPCTSGCATSCSPADRNLGALRRSRTSSRCAAVSNPQPGGPRPPPAADCAAGPSAPRTPELSRHRRRPRARPGGGPTAPGHPPARQPAAAHTTARPPPRPPPAPAPDPPERSPARPPHTCDAGSTATGRPPASTTSIPGNRRSEINRAAVNAGSSGPTVGRSCARSRALMTPQ